MRQQGRNLANLPRVAFVDNEFSDEARTCRTYGTDAPILAVERGQTGFKPIYSRKSAAELNEAEGVTDAQREAMLFGSMFGWHLPGADPDYHAALKRKQVDESEAMRS